MKIIKALDKDWIKGKGEMNYKKRIITDNIPASVNLIEEVLLSPGGEIPSHSHKVTFEIFYIINGRAKMKIGEREFEVNPKDMIFVEVGEEHSFVNDSNENFEMLVLKINFEKDDAILYKEVEKWK